MPLMIIESPNKIKKLKKILGQKFSIMATVGHFMKLDKKNMGFDKVKFDAKYIMETKKRTSIKKIIAEAKNHDVIYIATDPDREGEAIAKHIYDKLPKRGKKIHRIKFNSITKESVKKSLKNLGSIDQNLCSAQQARRLTDRIVGYKVSPVMWKKGLINTSAGRVQSVALKYIADREKEILAFNPKEYWSVSSLFDEGFSADLIKINNKKINLKNKADADKVLKSILKSKNIKITKLVKKNRELKPKPPFITSTLQQDASNSFNWPSKKTMNVAQTIFGHGLITYHRTDSVRTDDDKIDKLRDNIENLFGKKYLSKGIIKYGSNGNIQDAHEAIRPTYEQLPSNMLPDEKKLLKLITNRFVASQMSNASFDEVTVDISIIEGKNTFLFRAKGSSLKFDGFLKAYGNKKNDVLLPSLSNSQVLKLKNADKKQHFTKPSPRYSDASIIKKLEKEGVGRPSTYASIIETLTTRNYIERKKKALCATETGIMISDYLTSNFPSIVNTEFTAKMEEALDKIAKGDLQYIPVMDTFYKRMEKATEDAIKLGLPDAFIVDVECPKCKSKMIKKISKFGPFLACTKWPECNGTTRIGRDSSGVIEVETGKPCKSCGNVLVKRKGKNGEFWGCKSYPVFKNTEQIETEESVKNRVTCDKCNSGHMVERKGRYGKFYGCSSYPKCKNIKKKLK